MKHVKRILIVLIILFVGICIINAKTDFFLNIGTYVPELRTNFPQAASTVTFLSERLSQLTDIIPSFEEISAVIKREDPPIDPSDVAKNAYIANSPMLSFYPIENISLIVDNNTVQVFGISNSKDKAHLVVNFIDENSETLGQTSMAADSTGIFNKIIEIPDTSSYTLNFCVYTGSKEFGQFASWVYNYVTLERLPDGGWQIAESPVYRMNKELFEKDKSISDALKSTSTIHAGRDDMKQIAEQITNGIVTDYDKVTAIHDWICSYLYYDVDSLNSEDIPPYLADEVLKSGKAVCRGYATLMATLCRSIGIPCNIVTGYALGVGDDTEWTDETIVTDTQNHAWNEVYVDNRWIIVDTTWDCTRKIENGVMDNGTGVSHLYYDANLQFFSANHKIAEYYKR